MSAAENNNSTQHYASQQDIETAQQMAANGEKSKKKAQRMKFPKIFGKSKDKSSKTREKVIEHDSAASPGNVDDQHGATSQPEMQRLDKKHGSTTHLPSGLRKLFRWRKKKKKKKTTRKGDGTQRETETFAAAGGGTGNEKGQWQGFSSDKLEFLLEEILRRMENGGSLSQSTLSMASGYTEPLSQRMDHRRFQPNYRCGSAIDLSYGSAQNGDFSDHVATMPNFHRRRNKMASVSDIATAQSDRRSFENFRSMMMEQQHRNPGGEMLSDDDSDYNDCFSNGRSIEDLSSVMEQIPPELAYILFRKMKALDKKLERNDARTDPGTSSPNSIASSVSSLGRRTISPSFAKGPGVARPSSHPTHARLPTTEESSQEEPYYSVIDKRNENYVDHFENSSDRSSSCLHENAPSSPYMSGQSRDHDVAEMYETEGDLREATNGRTNEDQDELESSSGMSRLPRIRTALRNTSTSDMSEDQQRRENDLSDGYEETESPESVSTKLAPHNKRYDRNSERIEMGNGENNSASSNSKMRNKSKNEEVNYRPNLRRRHVTGVEVHNDSDSEDEHQDSQMFAQQRNILKRAQTPVNYESEEEEHEISEEEQRIPDRMLLRPNANRMENMDDVLTSSARNNQPNAGDHETMQDGPLNPPVKNQSEESSQMIHSCGDAVESINHDEEGYDVPTDGTNFHETMRNLQENVTENGESFLGDSRDGKRNNSGIYADERFWNKTEDAGESSQSFQGLFDGSQGDQRMDETLHCLSPIIEENQSGDRTDEARGRTNGKGEIFYKEPNYASRQNKHLEFDKGTWKKTASRGKDPNVSRANGISGVENLNRVMGTTSTHNEGREMKRARNDWESPLMQAGHNIFPEITNDATLKKEGLLPFYGSLEEIRTESEHGKRSGLVSNVKTATGGNENHLHQNEATEGVVLKAFAPSDSVNSEQFDTKWTRNENVSQKDLKAKGASSHRRPPHEFEQSHLPKMKLSKVMPSTDWLHSGGIAAAKYVEELEDDIGPTESLAINNLDDTNRSHWPKDPNLNGQIATQAAIKQTGMMEHGSQSDLTSDGGNSLESDWTPHRQQNRRNLKTTRTHSLNEPKSMEQQQLVNFPMQTEDQENESLPESWFSDNDSSIQDQFSTPDSCLGWEPDSPGLSSSGTQTIWLRDSQCQTPDFMSDLDEEHRGWTKSKQSRAVCWFIPVGSLDRWKHDESIRTHANKEKPPSPQTIMSPKQALQLHRPDFISRSRERQRQVKSIGRERLAARMRRRMRDEQKIRMFLEWQRCGNDIETWQMQEEELRREHQRKKKEKFAKVVNGTKKEEKTHSRSQEW